MYVYGLVVLFVVVVGSCFLYVFLVVVCYFYHCWLVYGFWSIYIYTICGFCLICLV